METPSLGRALGLALLLAASASAAAPAPGKGKSVTIVPGEAAGPGEPVPDPAKEKEALAAIASLASPRALPAAWGSAICNPAFWKALQEVDPSIASKGTPSKMVAGPAGTPAMEGRTFLQKPDGIAALLASPGFQKLMRGFAAGKARAATREERALIYSLIPFEIKGKPVTVVEKGGDVLFINTEGGGLWLDLISAYRRDPAPASAKKGGQIVRYGLYRVPEGKIAATSQGRLHILSERPTLDAASDLIPDRLGVSFGYEFVVAGYPAASRSDWKTVILHPPMSRPEGKTSKTSFSIEPELGPEGFSGAVLYRFDEKYEILKGRWTMQLVHKDEVVLEKIFEVVPATAVPAGSPGPAAASPAEPPEIFDACSNEISLLCHEHASDLPAAAKCLRSQPESLLSPCRKALGE